MPTFHCQSRLVSYTIDNADPNPDVVTTYSYDALGRRIIEGPTIVGLGSSEDPPGNDLYYSKDWQVIQEVQWVPDLGESLMQQQLDEDQENNSIFGFSPQNIDYIWSEMYIDAMVARIKTGQTLYVQHDANFNATAITNTSGVVQERFVYDAYGAATFVDDNWTPDTNGSDFGWVYLHQGGRFEANSGTYHFRNRDVSPTLGRPLQADPLGYPDGMNRYEFVESNPINYVDPFGLQASQPSGPLKTETIRPIETRHPGGYVWTEKFVPPDDKGGCIVQKIKITVKDKGGNTVHEEEYYEGWNVAPGETPEDQWYQGKPQPGFEGTIEQQGKATYYPGKQLPSDFKPGGVGTAKGLPSTPTDPKMGPGTAECERKLKCTITKDDTTATTQPSNK